VQNVTAPHRPGSHCAERRGTSAAEPPSARAAVSRSAVGSAKDHELAGCDSGMMRYVCARAVAESLDALVPCKYASVYKSVYMSVPRVERFSTVHGIQYIDAN
jgi:hypothetical protein